MNPRHVLLSTGVLETWFWRFQKKTSKSQVKLYHSPVRDQFWDQVLANFWCNVNVRLWRQVHVVASDASRFLPCREMSSSNPLQSIIQYGRTYSVIWGSSSEILRRGEESERIPIRIFRFSRLFTKKELSDMFWNLQKWILRENLRKYSSIGVQKKSIEKSRKFVKIQQKSKFRARNPYCKRQVKSMRFHRYFLDPPAVQKTKIFRK